MKKLFTPVVSALLISSLLLQSCATILSTPYQTVRVVGQPAGSTIYVNDKEVKAKPLAGTPGGVKLRLRRKKSSEVKVKHEGYKEYSEVVYPDGGSGTTYFNWLPVIGSFASALTPTDDYGNDTGISRIPGIGWGWLIGIGGWVVDISTGSNKKLNKREIKPILIRQPTVVAGSQSVQSGPITVRVKGGDKMGNLIVRGEPSDILYFGTSLDVTSDKLKDNVNSTLKDLGFTVPSSDGRSMFATGTSSRYTLQGEMRSITYDIHASNKYESRSRFETHCAVEVTWKLLNQSRQTVVETKTTGKAVKFEKGGSAAFEDAFENALYAFLENQEVNTALAKSGTGSTAAAKTDADANKPALITLRRAPAAKASTTESGSIATAARNVVTIEASDGHGSGCVISADGYIVTNAHVVGEEETVKITLADGLKATGKVVRVNPEMDLALVKIDADGLTAFQLPGSALAELGADVFAIGTPADKELGQSITKGIVSGRRKVEGHAYLQTDVSINGGNSGGALVTRSGQLVGIVNAKLVGRGIEGIGFAIPAELVTEALQLKFVD